MEMEEMGEARKEVIEAKSFCRAPMRESNRGDSRRHLTEEEIERINYRRSPGAIRVGYLEIDCDELSRRKEAMNRGWIQELVRAGDVANGEGEFCDLWCCHGRDRAILHLRRIRESNFDLAKVRVLAEPVDDGGRESLLRKTA